MTKNETRLAAALDLFARHVDAAEALRQQRHAIVAGYPASDTDGSPWHNESPFAPECLSAAMQAQAAAVDTFTGLRLLVLNTGIETDANGQATVTARILPNAVPGLLRQALEAAGRARWLLAASANDTRTARGFAATWEDATEAIKYANAAGHHRLDDLKAALERLIEDGRELDLLTATKDKPYWAPKVQINAIDSLRGLNFDPYPDQYNDLSEQARRGDDAVWIYRWLSGMTHGLGWGHSRRRVDPVDGTRIMLMPDYGRITLAAVLVEQAIRGNNNTLQDRLNDD